MDPSNQSDDPAPTVEAIANGDCYLLRNALSAAEQLELSAYVHARDRTPPQPRAMVAPAPRTLVLGDDGPTVRYRRDRGEASVATAMVDRGVALLQREAGPKLGGIADLARYTSISMAAIRYEAPEGRCPPHVDHCRNSAVFLVSLGRTANFMVRGKGQDEARGFQMRSGDALVFDASTEAGVLHGVEGIDVTASEAGEALAEAFPVFRTHRYGVQCRLSF